MTNRTTLPRRLAFSVALAFMTLLTGCPGPEPVQTPPPTTGTPLAQLPTKASSDVALFASNGELVATNVAGEELGSIQLAGDPWWCQLDPRGEVVWVLSETESADADVDGILEMVDLQNNARTTIATGIPTGGLAPEDVWIRYADNLGIAPPDFFFDVAIAIDMDPDELSVGPLLGCEGDRAVYCFDEGAEGFDEALESPEPDALLPYLNADIKTLYDALGAIEVIDEDALAAIGKRGGTNPVFPAFNQDEITLRGLSQEPCEVDPEQCGVGYLVAPERPLYRVTVGNSRGDYYHENVQLFDFSTQSFVSPDGSQKANRPLDSDHNLAGEYIVAPKANAWLDGEKLVNLEKGVVREGMTCGWIGGGYPFNVQH